MSVTRPPADQGVPFFRSLDGSMLVFGCERTPFALVVGAGVGPLYIGLFAMLQGSFLIALGCALVGLGILAGGVYGLRRMAKKDPMYVRTYLRFRKYRRFYPASSTPWSQK